MFVVGKIILNIFLLHTPILVFMKQFQHNRFFHDFGHDFPYFKVNATYPDEDIDLTFNIVPGSETVPFQIDSKTGFLTVSGSLVDNYKSIFNLTIMVEDGPHTEATTRRLVIIIFAFLQSI